ncbi:MAG: PAS domain S-box protein [Erysipelotrichia bacterium]|nr:PAS domain S-box protein [Erysipelotrichia bacterium]
MTKRIFRSVFWACVCILAVSLTLVIGVLNSHFTSIERTQLAAEAQLAAQGVETDGRAFFSGLDLGSYRVTWIDHDGTVLYDSSADPENMVNHSDREEFRQALSQGVGTSERYSTTISTRTMYYAIKAGDGTVVRTAITQDTIMILVLKMASPILIILLASMALSYVLARKLSQRIVSPINRLDLDHPLQNQMDEELFPLLEKIDEQNIRISEQMEQLKSSRKEFETITSVMSEGLILIDAKGLILSMNNAARTLLHAREDAEGKSILVLNRSNEMQKALEKVLQGSPDEEVLQLQNQSFEIHASPVFSDQQQRGACLVIFEVSDRRRAELQRQEFSANVSHELKSPLQTIIGASELLENHMVKKEDEDHFIQKIHRESEHLLHLIDDIIRLSQLDENQTEAAEDISIGLAVSEAVEGLQAQADRHHVLLNYDGSDAHILGVSRLIYEIAYNLIDNGIRYNKDHGSVIIRVKEDDSRAVLTVSDSGIGISEEQIPRIFERFYRADKSRSRSSGGTGLGLSIVKHAVQIHRAEIHVESKLGEGTVMTVIFPKGV